jgi:hypothetical protein
VLPLSLKVGAHRYIRMTKDIVTSSTSSLKAQVSQQLAQVVKSDIGITCPTQHLLSCSFPTAHIGPVVARVHWMSTENRGMPSPDFPRRHKAPAAVRPALVAAL